MGGRRLSAVDQGWPLARPFAISRGIKTEARVVVAEIEDADGHAGRGECVPYAHYGETVDSVIHQIAGIADAVAGGLDRPGLLDALPPGAARNAVDCALWDLEAKQADKRVWELAGLPRPEPAVTAETIGIASPQEMALQASRLAKAPLLKIKLDGQDVRARLSAVREAAPDARLVVDPNEGWDLHRLKNLALFLAEMGVVMLEQPVPVHGDDILRGFDCPVPICADESCHTAADLDRLDGLYDMVNIKLDKTGGADRGAGTGGRGRSRRVRVDGRLHGGNVACHGAGDGPDEPGQGGRSGRPASAARGPGQGPYVHRWIYPSAGTGPLGMI